MEQRQVNFMIALIQASFIALALGVGATAAAQTPQSLPSPTPRHPLPKPGTAARGFEKFAQRESSDRLVAAAATRGETDPASVAYEAGEVAYGASQYQKASENFARAAKLSPEWAEAHYALALSLTEEQKPREAIAEFEQVIKLKARYALMILSNYNLGNVHFDLHEYSEATDAYKRAIELNPELSKPHNNLGLAYAASNRLLEAIAEFNEAARLEPEYADAHFNLGVAYLEQGKKLEAREQQQALLKLDAALAAKLGVLLKK